jgi:uncharacterized protein YndB with AHSA1/START domain
MADTALTLTRIIDGPAEAVFRAWTDPVVLARWWGPGDFNTPEAELDVRPGGGYRIAMRSPDGATTLRIAGTYREVDPPRRLVFTWRWEEGGPDDAESLVIVELHPQGARTELVLTHGGFDDAETAAPYADGWGDVLPKLLALFSPPTTKET